MRFKAMVAVLFLVSSPLFAQTVAPLIMPRYQFFDSTGKPLAGGKLFFYQAGTSTPQATYVDSLGVIQNSNPVILDGGGAGVIWLASQTYRIVAQNSLGSQQWVLDNVQSFNGSINTTVNVTGVLISSSANPAQSGIVRFASGDCVKIRNTSNTLDLNLICKDSSDRAVIGDSTGAKFPAFVDDVGVNPAPQVSSAGQGRRYFDLNSNRYMASENAGAFGYSIKGLIPGCYPQTVAVPITGDTNEHTLFSCTLAANTLLAGGGPSSCLSVKVMFQKTANANATTFKFYLNGAGVAESTNSFTDNALDTFTTLICNNAAIQNAQTDLNEIFLNNLYAAGLVSDAANTATALTMKATITLGSAGDTVTGKYWFPLSY